MTQSKEEWRLVKGSDDYWISSRGNFKHGKKRLKTKPGQDGYARCNLGKQKKRVHRLVAEAFIPNPDNLPIVDHIDGCKTNNNVENLRWVTAQENTQLAYDNGLFDNVGQYRDCGVGVLTKNSEVYIYDTLVEASEFTGASTATISKCLRGYSNNCKEYDFFRVRELHDYRIKKG